MNCKKSRSIVLIETELDIEKNKIYTLEKYNYSTDNLWDGIQDHTQYLLKEAPTIKTDVLSKTWKHCQAIYSNELWCKIKGELLIIGKGSSVMSVPVEWLYIGGIDYLYWLLESISFTEYKYWYRFRWYPFEKEVA